MAPIGWREKENSNPLKGSLFFIKNNMPWVSQSDAFKKVMPKAGKKRKNKAPVKSQ